MKIVAFYNPKAGVGCTSLVYHMAWMYRELGLRVLVVDADPQGDLSGMLLGFNTYPFVGDNADWPHETLENALHVGVRDTSYVVHIDDGIGAVTPGSLHLEKSAEASGMRALWLPDASERAAELGSPRLARMRRLCVAAASEMSADIVLIDVEAGLGLLACLSVTAADALVVPLSADDPGVHGALQVEPTVTAWATTWRSFVQTAVEGVEPSSASSIERQGAVERLLPSDHDWLGEGPRPLGYVVANDASYAGFHLRGDASAVSHLPLLSPTLFAEPADSAATSEPWRGRLPPAFAKVAADPHCLGVLLGYVSLRDLSLRARKPMFALSPADGALGSLAVAVTLCRREYEALARTIAARMLIEL